MVDGKVIGIITVTDLAEHLRRILLMEQDWKAKLSFHSGQIRIITSFLFGRAIGVPSIAFTVQLLITGLKIRRSLHILRTLSSAKLLDCAVIIIFRFLVDLTDLIFEYPL